MKLSVRVEKKYYKNLVDSKNFLIFVRRKNPSIGNTRQQNQFNKNKYSVSKNKYKGVSFNGYSWRAKIQFNKKHYYLGAFKTEIEAAKAYDEAAKKYHGEFANLNFK